MYGVFVTLRHPALSYGGLYVDLDYECLKSIDPLLERHHGVVLAWMSHDKTRSTDPLPYVDCWCCWLLLLHCIITAMHGWRALLGMSFGCT